MSPLLALLLAVGILGLGPILALGLERRPGLRALLDGFVLVMVGGLCLLFLLPHAYEGLVDWHFLGFPGAGWTFLIAALGFLLPYLSHRNLIGFGEAGVSKLVLALAFAGLALHASVDGVALAVGGEHAHHEDEHGAHGQLEVVLAILAHRLPVSLLVWTTLVPLAGRAWAAGVLAILALATGGGFLFSSQLLVEFAAGAFPAAINALLAGGLLHVILDHGPAPGTDLGPRPQTMATLGALAAGALFAVLPIELIPAIREAGVAAWHLLAESSPAILLGFLGAGLLSLVPAATLARLMTGKTAFTSAMRGVVFGLPIPICSCGVVPIYRGLMGKGVPPAAAIAFLIATPELGVDSILISIPLLGVEMTLYRLAAALCLAVVAGLAVSAIAARTPSPEPAAAGDTCDAGDACDDEDPFATPADGSRTSRALRYGFVEAMDDLGPWILTGLLLAGALQPLLDPAWIARLPGPAEVPLFAVVAMPLYVCASAITPVAAVLMFKGVSAGAVIALLLTGPATNVTTYGALRLFHGRRVTTLAIAIVIGTSVALGVIVNLLHSGDLAGVAGSGAHAPSLLNTLAAAAFVALLAGCLFRKGPRGILAQLGLVHVHQEGDGHDHGDGQAGHDHGDHGHEHGDHGHGHDHGGHGHDHGDHTHGEQTPPRAPETSCCGPKPGCGAGDEEPAETAAGSS
jgi:uncharacterized protein